jgi:hypothetical protein
MHLIFRAAGALFTTAALAIAKAPPAGANPIAEPHRVTAVNPSVHPANDGWGDYSRPGGYDHHDSADDTDGAGKG